MTYHCAMHSIPRAFRESAPFYLVATLMASAFLFGFAWTFTWSKATAEKTAREEGGLTRITFSERQLFAWCRKGYVGYTVEGYLEGVQDFADSANRTTGHQRLVAVIVVGLILLGVILTIWFALGDILA